MPYLLVLLLSLAAVIAPAHADQAPANDGRRVAVELHITGPIGPATGDYIDRGFEEAGHRDAAIIIIEMDTPGGLDTAMRGIIQKIIASPVPVVTYVAPSGARAASAGTYILYASHVAAMAPGTNVGAATPVQIGGLPGGGSEPPDKGKPGGADKGRQGGAEQGTMERKITNDAVAYIRSLAQMRGRNAEWAEQAVREAASLPAKEALDKGVIDLMAADVHELLDKLDGRKVTIANRERVLHTKGLALIQVRPDWRTKLLGVLTDPNVAYILMLVGIYGLIYEFISPGMIIPGVAGLICLVLALFAFQILPINYTGLGLIAARHRLHGGRGLCAQFRRPGYRRGHRLYRRFDHPHGYQCARVRHFMVRDHGVYPRQRRILYSRDQPAGQVAADACGDRQGRARRQRR